MSVGSVPPTRRDVVSDVLHGVRVDDPYRWLEDGQAAEVAEWTEAQNRYTEEWLSAEPARREIRQRLERLLSIGVLGTPTPASGRYLYLRRDGAVNQPILYVRDGVDGADRVVVDPNALAADGTVALDWYHVSPGGERLAYGLSEGGSEQSTLHVLELGTGEALADRIERTRACDLAWLPDASGFYYTRYPAPGEVAAGDEVYHRSVHFHALGTDAALDPLVFRPTEKEHWPGVALSDDGRWLIVTVARTFDQADVYLLDRSAGGPLRDVVVGQPYLFDVAIVRGAMYVRSNMHGPTFGLYAGDPEVPAPAGWHELVAPVPGRVLSSAGVTAEWLVLDYLERACARLELQAVRREGGKAGRSIELPTLGSLFGLGYEPDGKELFYGFSSWTVPPCVYRVDLETGEQRLWRRVEADVDPARYDVRQVEYPSKDGTPVTMFVARRRGQAGRAPCLLTGYGGFSISMTPSFSRSMLLWLESGGVVAVPNLRGGGEYGEAWHQAGMLERKQNTFDDFVAAAEWLIAEGITEPALLAAQGGSNGGLLMGAVLTQRPDLFGAVVIQVPLLDMLRYHRFLLARLWIPEYGSPDDPEQFPWLASYSPYHHVRDGAHYPAVLLATAASDSRVDPLHARKMAARLQAASGSGRPVLLRLESRAGHGAGKPLAKVLDELTDTWTFIWHELGLAPPGR